MPIIKVTAETPVPDEVKNHPSVKPCTGHCGRYTRGTEMKIEEFPATVSRVIGGKCQKCLNDDRREGPDALRAADAQLRQTVTGLESWLAGRRSRLSRPRIMA